MNFTDMTYPVTTRRADLTDRRTHHYTKICVEAKISVRVSGNAYGFASVTIHEDDDDEDDDDDDEDDVCGCEMGAR